MSFKSNLSASRKPAIYFPNLDSLRFIAFMLVFLQHGFFNSFEVFYDFSSLSDRFLNLIFLGGGTGVQIFFVLSGFLITYLLITEIQFTGKVDIFQFYLRRLLRIWPLYYATVIFAFIIYPGLKNLIGLDSNLCSRPWYYFTFLANFDSIFIAQNCPGRGAMTQSIVWSVSIEEQFYIFWPLLIHFFRKFGLPLVFIVVIIASLIFRFINIENPFVLYFHTFSVMGDLAIGSLSAYLVLTNKIFANVVKHLPRYVILICYIVILAAYLYFDYLLNSTIAVVLSRIILDLFWVFIILEQCFSKNSLFELGGIKLFSSLGKITYGLYMLHPIGILVVDITCRLLKIPQHGFLISFISGIVALLLSIGLARLSYRFLEKPFLMLKERFSIVRNKTINV